MLSKLPINLNSHAPYNSHNALKYRFCNENLALSLPVLEVLHSSSAVQSIPDFALIEFLQSLSVNPDRIRHFLLTNPILIHFSVDLHRSRHSVKLVAGVPHTPSINILSASSDVKIHFGSIVNPVSKQEAHLASSSTKSIYLL